MPSREESASTSESGLSGWPTLEVVQQFWAVPASLHMWGTTDGWLIYRSTRTGMVYREELVLGGPMPAWLALNFLQSAKGV